MTQHDALGTRMKENYELRTRTLLPRRTWTVIRLDGKAFHTYTRGLERPWDHRLAEDMARTAEFLCEQIQGCRLAYTQSDEITLVLTDFASPQTQAWLDGNVQKIVSISASMATAQFNTLRPGAAGFPLAFFDSRAFTIPDPVEVRNMLIWRQLDATRNSISMAAQAQFSHKELHGKDGNQMQEMLFAQKGINWNEYPEKFKRGTLVRQVTKRVWGTYTDKRTGELRPIPDVERRFWEIEAAPIFTQDRTILPEVLPECFPLEVAHA